MKKEQVVSVIVPCRDRQELLFSCLESVARQTYQEIELILVDDASTEDIQSTLKKIKFPFGIKPQYIRSEENVGPGAARELGRLKATGDYICYLDSDDTWHPRMIEEQLHIFREKPELGMCYCASMNVDHKTGHSSLRLRSDETFEQILPIILVTRPWGTGACMWARWAVEKIGPWFPGWGREDIEYDLRAGCLDIPITNTAEVLCYYRVNSGDQLRDARREVLIRQFISAELKMAENLTRYDKITDSFIRKRMILNLFHLGVELLEYDDLENAKKCWKTIWQLAKRDVSVYVFVIAAYLLFPIKIGRKLIILLKRGIRFVIIPLHVRKGEFRNENISNH
jgi:glycosyltransferase involved in cell wall biosynthesis